MANRPPLKRASYRAGVEWIAMNDEPTERDPELVKGVISVCLLADLFGCEAAVVAQDVVRYREKHGVGA